MREFDDQLNDLMLRLREMGELARTMVARVTAAVKDRALDLGMEIAESDRRLDQMQTDIDRDAIRVLTVYGPLATGLRCVLVVTHVTAELERMGDQAVNLGQALNLIGTAATAERAMSNVRRMADLACGMVEDALDALFCENEAKAMETRRRDDAVDDLKEQVVRELLSGEVAGQVAAGAARLADIVALILIAHSIERIADLAKNIAKQVVYLVRGEDVRHVRPD